MKEPKSYTETTLRHHWHNEKGGKWNNCGLIKGSDLTVILTMEKLLTRYIHDFVKVTVSVTEVGVCLGTPLEWFLDIGEMFPYSWISNVPTGCSCLGNFE